MLASPQSTSSSVRRDAWLEVDLSALEANVNMIRSWLKPGAPECREFQLSATGRKSDTQSDVKLMAVVKSDAYGHGAQGVAEVLIGAGCESLAVASVDEGCQLRAVDVRVPILILSPTPSWAVSTAIEHQLDITVTDRLQVKEIERLAARLKQKARLNLKVDTGMHRLGIAVDETATMARLISESKNLALVSIFSHLAKAGEEQFTNTQDSRFRQALADVAKQSPGLLKRDGGTVLAHLASSEATRHFPFSHHDMVRVGLYLYGLEPKASSDLLVPALSVRGRINHVKTIAAGESVGYNLTFTAGRSTRLASIPIGYADGVDRGLSNRMGGLVMGKRVPQVGTISMDQMIFDITDVPEAQDGDVITLVGKDGGEIIYLADWANLLDTITYELACRLKVRLPRIYTRQHKLSLASN